LEVFALKIVLAMELLTILNQCHHHRGFVYQHARFAADKKSIEVDVRPRVGSAAVCSGCHRPAPGYDHLPQRRGTKEIYHIRSLFTRASDTLYLLQQNPLF
jgi:hypothetical protein